MSAGNRWNRLVYRLWAPIYDPWFEKVLHAGRLRSMEVAGLQAGERVCLVGVGTGTDLTLLPEGVSALGIDLSEAMLARARRKLPIAGREIELLQGDAQQLPPGAGEAAFDVVILNLVLAIVPDARRCMAEAVRVLRPGGRMVVYDKFLPDGVRPSLPRRLANALTTVLGTRINRHFGEIIEGQPLEVELAEPSIMGGMYRIYRLRKKGGRGAGAAADRVVGNPP